MGTSFKEKSDSDFYNPCIHLDSSRFDMIFWEYHGKILSTFKPLQATVVSQGIQSINQSITQSINIYIYMYIYVYIYVIYIYLYMGPQPCVVLEGWWGFGIDSQEATELLVGVFLHCLPCDKQNGLLWKITNLVR